MKRTILFMTVLCLVLACSPDVDEVITKADDALFLLMCTNLETTIRNTGDGYARVHGEFIGGDGGSMSIQVVQFSPKDINILLDHENEHYDALGDILYMYANPDTYDRGRFDSLWTNFRGTEE